MKAHALFEEMSALVDRIRRCAIGRTGRGVAGADALRRRLGELCVEGRLDETRKIVATKEGGAITGEERIREHLDDLYGALTARRAGPRATRSSASRRCGASSPTSARRWRRSRSRTSRM